MKEPFFSPGQAVWWKEPCGKGHLIAGGIVTSVLFIEIDGQSKTTYRVNIYPNKDMPEDVLFSIFVGAQANPCLIK